jgi:hypothetical protein
MLHQPFHFYLLLYSTNLMIYGPGGYKYNDFMAIGTPMQIVLWLLTVVLLVTTTASNFYISWIASIGALLLVVLTCVCDVKTWLKSLEEKSIAAKATTATDQSSITKS